MKNIASQIAYAIAFIFLGVGITLLYQTYAPKMPKSGEYQLMLPHQGALVMQENNSNKGKLYQVPDGIINFVVDPARAWQTSVKSEGFYRMITVYVPSKEYLPESAQGQPTKLPTSFDDSSALNRPVTTE